MAEGGRQRSCMVAKVENRDLKKSKAKNRRTVANLPVNALESSTMLVREVMLPMDEGMVPVSRLLSSWKFRTDVSPPMDEGSEPDNINVKKRTQVAVKDNASVYGVSLQCYSE